MSDLDELHGMSGAAGLEDSSGMRRKLWDYWSGHGSADVIAEDAVFHELASKRDYRGKAEIGEMFHWFYEVALDAHSVPRKLILDEEEDAVAIAGRVIGRHTGEFAGVPATGKEINVHMCVTYALRDGQIREAWIYFNVPEFLRQVGAAPA